MFGGIYEAEITYTDIFEEEYTATYDIQIFNKEPIKLELNKVFMWIFDYYSSSTLNVKDIVEIADYDITIDEETNANSIVKVLKHTSAKAKDVVAIKKNNEVIYWGVIDEIQNTDGANSYQFTLKYITNLFDRKIRLTGDNVIRETGIEDFLEDTIELFFTDNPDTFINMNWLDLSILSHTPKDISVTNVENRIYNLHTWLTNCTQNYDIVYTFSITNKKLLMAIKCMTYDKELIDTTAQNISNYTEVFETNVMAKVICLYDKKEGVENQGQYVLFLKTDRTTTTSSSDPDRAEGNLTTIFTENYEDARQSCLDEMKANEYNHNITFNYDKYVKVGTPIAIKTKNSIIYYSYISSIKITPKKFYEYICGNIRINFIDKLLKEKNNGT